MSINTSIHRTSGRLLDKVLHFQVISFGLKLTTAALRTSAWDRVGPPERPRTDRSYGTPSPRPRVSEQQNPPRSASSGTCRTPGRAKPRELVRMGYVVPPTGSSASKLAQTL